MSIVDVYDIALINNQFRFGIVDRPNTNLLYLTKAARNSGNVKFSKSRLSQG